MEKNFKNLKKKREPFYFKKLMNLLELVYISLQEPC